jgi:hypothetical protein
MKIPLYVPKWAEEMARAVGVAVGSYVVMSITANGVPDDKQTIAALLTGAVPIIWAAVRGWLNATPLTPDVPKELP